MAHLQNVNQLWKLLLLKVTHLRKVAKRPKSRNTSVRLSRCAAGKKAAGRFKRARGLKALASVKWDGWVS